MIRSCCCHEEVRTLNTNDGMYYVCEGCSYECDTIKYLQPWMITRHDDARCKGKIKNSPD